MRLRILVSTGVVAFAMLATNPVVAAEGAPGGAKKTGQPTWDAKLKALDVNGDRMITFAEWSAGDDAFEALDWDHDGILSGREVLAGAVRPDFPPPAPLAGGETAEAAYERMDADHNYRLTRAEWGGTATAFGILDVNRDGALSPFEFGVGR
jgi:hypothetical protein